MHKNPQEQVAEELRKMESIIMHGCSLEDEDAQLIGKLCCKYPYQYVKAYAAIKKGVHDLSQPTLIRCFVAAFYLTDEAWWKLQRFLVYPPQGEKEEQEFKRSVVFLWPLLTKQNREN